MNRERERALISFSACYHYSLHVHVHVCTCMLVPSAIGWIKLQSWLHSYHRPSSPSVDAWGTCRRGGGDWVYIGCKPKTVHEHIHVTVTIMYMQLYTHYITVRRIGVSYRSQAQYMLIKIYNSTICQNNFSCNNSWADKSVICEKM